MRVTITMRDNELQALAILAERECRDSRAQALFIIRDELTRRGLLSQEQPTIPHPVQTLEPAQV